MHGLQWPVHSACVVSGRTPRGIGERALIHASCFGGNDATNCMPAVAATKQTNTQTGIAEDHLQQTFVVGDRLEHARI